MLQGGNGGRPEAKSVVVMVTDGASNNKVGLCPDTIIIETPLNHNLFFVKMAIWTAKTVSTICKLSITIKGNIAMISLNVSQLLGIIHTL